MDIALALPYAGILLGAYGAFKGHFVSKEAARRDEDIAILKKQMDLIWGMVEQHMTTILHSPHTPDLDKLLEKFQAGEDLSPNEQEEFATLLLDTINDDKEAQGTRAGAFWILAALERRKLVAGYARGSEVKANGNSV